MPARTRPARCLPLWGAHPEEGFTGGRCARTLAPWTRPCTHKVARPTTRGRASLSGSCKAGVAVRPSVPTQRQKAGTTRFRPSGLTTAPRSAAGQPTAAAVAGSMPRGRSEGVDAARHPLRHDRSVFPGHHGKSAGDAGQQAGPRPARVALRRKHPEPGARGVGVDEGQERWIAWHGQQWMFRPKAADVAMWRPASSRSAALPVLSARSNEPHALENSA